MDNTKRLIITYRYIVTYQNTYYMGLPEKTGAGNFAPENETLHIIYYYFSHHGYSGHGPKQDKRKSNRP